MPSLTNNDNFGFSEAQALVSILDFCLPQHKAEILWRTNTSRETVTPEICWKRSQLIQKELERLATLAKQFVEPGRGHQEIVDLLEQHLFVSARITNDHILRF